VAQFGDKEVGRLDVAMDDVLGMRCIQRIGNLNTQPQNRVDLEWPGLDPLFQGLALEKFHGDEGAPIVFINFINRADVGMVQGRRSFGFAPEAAKSFGILCDRIGKEFERDKASQLKVLSLVDDAHTPAAGLLDHTIVRDGWANHGIGAMLGAMQGQVNESRGVGGLSQRVVEVTSRFHLLTGFRPDLRVNGC
jgi:hypothetical protein